jgi:hypothetical protein
MEIRVSICLFFFYFSVEVWSIGLSEGSANKEAIEPRVPIGQVQVITSNNCICKLL